LIADIYFSDIGSLYWEKLQRHASCRILRMSVKGVSTIFSFESWLIYVPIGCRHPFIKYWQPLLAKTTVKCSLRILKMSVNGASTGVVVAYLVIMSWH
jgi:hypothetical protein